MNALAILVLLILICGLFALAEMALAASLPLLHTVRGEIAITTTVIVVTAFASKHYGRREKSALAIRRYSR